MPCQVLIRISSGHGTDGRHQCLQLEKSRTDHLSDGVLSFSSRFLEISLLDPFNPCIHITVSKLGSYPGGPALYTYTILYLMHFKFHFSAVTNDSTSLSCQCLEPKTPSQMETLPWPHWSSPRRSVSQSKIPSLLYPSKLHEKISYPIYPFHACLGLFSTQVNPISLTGIFQKWGGSTAQTDTKGP